MADTNKSTNPVNPMLQSGDFNERVKQMMQKTAEFNKSQSENVTTPSFGTPNFLGESRSAGHIDMSSPDLKYIAEPTLDNYSNARAIAERSQTNWDKIKAGGARFLAGVATGASTNIIELLDVESTVKNIMQTEENFDSEVFGIKASDILDWNREVSEDNSIYYLNGEKDRLSVGYLAETFGNTGISVGIALSSAITTMLIPGLGGVANARKALSVPNMINTVRGMKAAEGAKFIYNNFKAVNKTAAAYTVINRLGESKMNAAETYTATKARLTKENNEGKLPEKLTEDQIEVLARAAGTKSFNMNMAWLPVDLGMTKLLGMGAGNILPSTSGADRLLSSLTLNNINNKWARRSAKIGASAVEESFEEMYQKYAGDFGEAKAYEMSGLTGKKSTMDILKEGFDDDLLEAAIQGAAGSPIVIGAHKALRAVTGGLATDIKYKNQVKAYRNAFSDMGVYASQIDEALKAGDVERANSIKDKVNKLKVIQGLSLDSIKEEGQFENARSYAMTLDKAINDINSGNFKSAIDLGFNVEESNKADVVKSLTQYKDTVDSMLNFAAEYNGSVPREMLPAVVEAAQNVKESTTLLANANSEVSVSESNAITMGASQEFIDLTKTFSKYQALDVLIKRKESQLSTSDSPVHKQSLSNSIAALKQQKKEIENNLGSNIKDLKKAQSEGRTTADEDKSISWGDSVGDLKIAAKGDTLIKLAENYFKQSAIESSVKENQSTIDFLLDEKTQKNWFKRTPDSFTNPQELKEYIKTTGDLHTNDEIEVLENTLRSLEVREAKDQEAQRKAEEVAKKEEEENARVAAEIEMQRQATQGTQQPVQPQQQQVVEPEIQESAEPEQQKSETQELIDFIQQNPIFPDAQNTATNIATDVVTNEDVVVTSSQPNVTQAANNILDGGITPEPPQDPNMVSVDIMSLFGNPAGPPVDGFGDPNDDGIVYEPALIDEDPATVARNAAAVKAFYEGYMSDRNVEPSFEDMLNFLIDKGGKERVELLFNGLKGGWVSNGYSQPIIGFDKVYNNYFNSLEQLGLDLLDTLQSSILTDKEGNPITTKVDNYEHKSVPPPSGPIEAPSNTEVTPEGNTTLFLPTRRYSSTQPKLAFNQMGSERVIKKIGGNRFVTFESDTDAGSFSSNSKVAHEKLSDLNYMPIGTEFRLVVAGSEGTSIEGIQIRDVYPDGTTKSVRFLDEISFEDDSDYIDRIPIYAIGPDGTAVAWIPDVATIVPGIFKSKEPGDIDIYKENLRRIRRQVVRNFRENGSGTTAVVTARESTNWNDLLLKDGSTVSLAQANPQSSMGYIREVKGSNGTQYEFVGENGLRIPSEQIFNGAHIVENLAKNHGAFNAVDARPFGLDSEGKMLYVVSYLNMPKGVSQESSMSFSGILEAVSALKTAGISEAEKKVYNDFADEVQRVSSYDIRTIDGLGSLLALYVAPVHSNSFISKINELKKRGVDKTSNFNGAVRSALRDHAVKLGGFNDFYYYLDSTGNLYYAYKQPNGEFMTEYLALNIYSKNADITLNDAENGFFKKVFNGTFQKYASGGGMSYNWNSITGKDITLPIIAKDESTGAITVEKSKNYKDNVRENIQTSLMSVNIGTEENPNYVTNVNPNIIFDIKDNMQEERPSVKEVETFVDLVQEVNNIVEEDVLDEIDKQLEELGFSDDDILFEPVLLEESVFNSVTSSFNLGKNLSHPDLVFFAEAFSKNILSAKSFLDGETLNIGKFKDNFRKIANDHFDNLIVTLNNYLEEVSLLPPSQRSDAVRSKILKSLELAENAKGEIEQMIDIPLQKLSKYTKVEVGDNPHEGDSSEVESSDEAISEEGVVELEGARGTNKSFSSDSLSIDPKLGTSARVKILCDGIIDQIIEKTEDGVVYKPVKGLAGLPVYLDFENVFEEVMNILADTSSDFNAQMEILMLPENLEAKPWLKSLVEKLKEADPMLQKEFASIMSKHALDMEFVMLDISMDYDTAGNSFVNSINTMVYKTNSNQKKKMIENEWRDNLINNPNGNSLYTLQGNVFRMDSNIAVDLITERARWAAPFYNILENTPVLSISEMGLLRGLSMPVDTIEHATSKVELSKLIESGKLQYSKETVLSDGSTLKELEYRDDKSKEYNKVSININNGVSRVTRKVFNMKFVAGTLPSDNSVLQFLNGFGITISDRTLEHLKTRGLYVGKQHYSYQSLFNPTNEGSFINKLSKFLKDAVNDPDLRDLENNENPLFSEAVRSLVSLESRYNNKVSINSFRDGAKSLYGYTQTKYVVDEVNELKDPNSGKLAEVMKTDYSKNSLWGSWLGDSESDFINDFGVVHMGVTALKQYKRAVFGDKSFTGLSSADDTLLRDGLFINGNQRSFKTKEGYIVRPSKFISPTNSDKTQAIIINGYAIDFNQMINPVTGDFTDAGLEVLYNQLVKPDLLRIKAELDRAADGIEANISKHKAGALLFYSLPKLNNVMVGSDDIVSVIGKNNVESFEKEFKDLIKKHINNAIRAEVDEELDSRISSKLHYPEQGLHGLKINDKFKQRYLTDGATEDMAVRKYLMDYSANYRLANANYHMMVAGDPAMYYKKEGSTDKTDYEQIVKDTFINVGKRLANQIAPGTKIAHNKDEKYIQIMFSNAEKSLKGYAKDFYENILGKEGASAYTGYSVDKEGNTTYKGDVLDAADAWEMTTWKEHLHILEGMGRLPSMEYNTEDGELHQITIDDINTARELLENFDENTVLTKNQENMLKIIFQPMKPVYTGRIYDSMSNSMRPVYIKSSSIPLLPHVTAGKPIDKVRRMLEAAEAKANKDSSKPTRFVRGSYQSANKVGSVAKPVKIWNEDFSDVSFEDPEAFGQQIIDEGAGYLELPRKYFRIQQDVPFKTKGSIPVGTQTTKLIFGEGVLDITSDFTLVDGTKMKAKDLHSYFEKAYGDLLKLERKTLEKRLGIVDGKIGDIEKFNSEVSELLMEEFESRGNQNRLTISGLEIVNGQFRIPLWLSADSNKIENLLSSLVTNKVSKIKMPGFSSPVGSQVGFNKYEQIGESDYKDKVIYTDKYDFSKGLQYLNDEDGNITFSQVLIPNKFKGSDGNVIDFFKRKDGKYVYLEEVGGSFRLKLDMMSPELMKMFSFRIPTSKISSMAIIEVAGFMPYEQGDLMIVPDTFTQQKGLDFDIDKENVYMYNTFTREDGGIEVFNESNRWKQYESLGIESKEDFEEIVELFEKEDGIRHQFNKYKKEGQTLEDFEINLEFLEDVLPEDEAAIKEYSSAVKRLRKRQEKFELQGVEENYNFFRNAIATVRKNWDNDERKLLQNKIVDTHIAVLSNPDVFPTVMSTVNMDYAKEQAEVFTELMNPKTSIVKYTMDELADLKNIEGDKRTLVKTSSGLILKADSVEFEGQTYLKDINTTDILPDPSGVGRKWLLNLPKEVFVAQMQSLSRKALSKPSETLAIAEEPFGMDPQEVVDALKIDGLVPPNIVLPKHWADKVEVNLVSTPIELRLSKEVMDKLGNIKLSSSDLTNLMDKLNIMGKITIDC